MSLDESNAPQPELSPSMAARVPAEVYTQLTKSFLPAVQQVSACGQALAKAYQTFQQASDDYCFAMHALIKSSDNAMPRAKYHVSQLNEVYGQYVRAVKAHKPCAVAFSGLADNISAHTAKEKEQLKDDYHNFQKEEKKILKSRSKNAVTQAQVDAFYRNTSSDWAKQQEMRYKFFNDRFRRWIATYGDLLESVDVNKIVPQKPVTVPVPASTRSTVNNDWHEQIHAEEAALNGHAHGTANVVRPTPILQQTPILSETFAVKDRQETVSSQASTLTDHLPSATEESPGVTLVHRHNRESIIVPQTVIAPAPVVTAPFPAPDYRPIAQQEVIPPSPPASAHHGHRAGHSIAGAVPVFGLVNQQRQPPPAPPVPTERNYHSRHENGYEVVTSGQIRVGRVVDNPRTEEDFSQHRYSVHSNYNPITAPSHQPSSSRIQQHRDSEIIVEQTFNSGQYGCILTINDDFNASSGEQITVNKNDRVILLKSGSRGWIYVRDAISGRCGWIPAPYANQ